MGSRQLIDTPPRTPDNRARPPAAEKLDGSSHGQRRGCGGSRPHALPEATPCQIPLHGLVRFQRASPCRQRTNLGTPITHAHHSNGVGDKAAAARANLIGDGRTSLGRHDLNVPENNDTDGTHPPVSVQPGDCGRRESSPEMEVVHVDGFIQ